MEMKLDIPLDNKDKYNWSVALLKMLLKDNLISDEVYKKTEIRLQKRYKINLLNIG